MDELRYFDSHAHYNDRRFRAELPGGADALLGELFAADVCGIVNVGTNPVTNREVVEQARAWPHMYAAVGIHPEDCHLLRAGLEETMAELAAWLTPESRRRNKIAALGEIGLDYHYETYGEAGEIPLDREREKAFLAAQLSLARSLDVPVIIHDRDAHGDIMDMLLAYPGVRGVVHSFSGSAEMARDLCRRGWYISFSGTVTFTNARRVREAAAAVPPELALIETDCPYLAPHPFRGQINSSGYLRYMAGALAQVQGTTLENVAEQTRKNACTLFGISDL